MTASKRRPVMAPWKRALTIGALAFAAACAQQATVKPFEVTQDTTDAMDGMLLVDFPGPKGQIVYDQGPPDFFCDTVGFMSALLAPEQHRRVLGAFTEDMAKTSWDKPQGHWIDARSAWFVEGSRKTGAMGKTLATFSSEADARAFAEANGGTVLAFSSITPQRVALDGGVLKDDTAR